MSPFDNMSDIQQSKGTSTEEKPVCRYCGKPSTNFLFAAFVCDSEDCINKAMDDRGGPGGHKKDPKKWMKENE